MSTAPDPRVPRAKSDILAVAPGLRPERDDRFARVRRGVYVEQPPQEASAGDASPVPDAPGRDAHYLLRIRAVQLTRSQPVFARESALAVHGVPFGLEPDAVYTVGGASTARKKGGVVHATVEPDMADIVRVGDLLACSLAYALADVARRRDRLVAVSAIDAALRRRAVTKQEILDALSRQSARGRTAAEWAIAFADGDAESVGESWSRVRVFELGFAAPELQHWVAGPTGTQWRVDMRFLRPGRRPVYGEFDGLVKYGALANQAGKSGAQALAHEKRRDDELLFSGDPAHWIWADVQQPTRLERILDAYGVPRVRRRMLVLSTGR